MADAFSKNDKALKMLMIADNHVGDRIATLVASKNKNGVRAVLKGFAGEGDHPVTVPMVKAES